MRTLTIGSTVLELNSFAKKWDRGRGVYAEIKIPTTAISHDELKALFSGNAEDLIVTEEDGSTETFSGYAELDGINENISAGVFVVTQYCTETAMHLLNEARKQIDAQANTIAMQKNEIAIIAKEKAELQEQLAMQSAVLDELLTDILPSMMVE